MGCFEISVERPPCFKISVELASCFRITTEPIVDDSCIAKINLQSYLDGRTIQLCFTSGDGSTPVVNEWTGTPHPFLENVTCGDALSVDTGVERKYCSWGVSYGEKYFSIVEAECCVYFTGCEDQNTGITKALPAPASFNVSFDKEDTTIVYVNGNDCTAENAALESFSDECNDSGYCEAVNTFVAKMGEYYPWTKIVVNYDTGRVEMI